VDRSLDGEQTEKVLKAKGKEKTMKTTNLKKGPHGIALEHVDKSHSLVELWDRVTEEMELEDWDKLYSAIDPEYEQKQKKQQLLFEKVKQALPSEEARKTLNDYEDSCVDETTTRERANFILGVAAGQRLSSPR
jgi:hypothetical protein